MKLRVSREFPIYRAVTRYVHWAVDMKLRVPDVPGGSREFPIYRAVTRYAH